MRITHRSILIAIAAVVVGGLAFAGVAAMAQSGGRGSAPKAFPGPSSKAPSFALTQRPGMPAVSLADVTARALPSVVNIASKKALAGMRGPMRNNPFFRWFRNRPNRRGMPRGPLTRGLGSGVIISADGAILTNYHVVRNAQEIKVTTHDKREFLAKVVGSDPKSDLALLRPKQRRAIKNLKPITFGDSKKLRLGDVVLAIGNPFGVGQTVTMGIVSAKGRANVGLVDYENFIQTDAAINPGNSGGALVNMEGKLVGINTAILSRSGGYQGIGFAIPSNMVDAIAKQLVKRGRVIRGWLGVGIQTVNQSLAQGLGLTVRRGVLVSHVEPGSPAARAGLKRKDVIVSIDGHRVDTAGRLRTLVAGRGANARIRLQIVRGNSKLTLQATLAALPGQGAPRARRPQRTPTPPSNAVAGLSLSRLDAAARQKFGISSRVQHGLVVNQVQRGSAAASAGLRPGDVILQMNHQPLSRPSELRRRWQSTRRSAVLLVYRRGMTIFLVLRK